MRVADAPEQYTLEPNEWGILASALNEVLNAFAVSNFERTIGADRAAVESLFTHLRTVPETFAVTLDAAQIRLARGALRETLRELGSDEFDTRTGYDFDFGSDVLATLETVV